MNRRDFTKATIATTLTAASSGIAAGSTAVPSQESTPEAGTPKSFRLSYAPHFGMFEHHAGKDLISQLEFMRDQGFTALEDNVMGQRDPQTQVLIAEALERLGMRMGVFVVNMWTAWRPTLATGAVEMRDRFLEECRNAVDVARRVGATWMTVVPGLLDPRLELDYQAANVVDALRRAAEILEPHGLVMVLEPLNHRRDHPGLFLTKTAQAHLICRAVDSPSCKILFDAYHQQITEGNLIPNMELAWNEIAYIQVGDNPGRHEPTTGEINYRNIFRFLHEKGYAGIVGMEHGRSRGGKEGEQAVIDAYRWCDAF